MKAKIEHQAGSCIGSIEVRGRPANSELQFPVEYILEYICVCKISSLQCTVIVCSNQTLIIVTQMLLINYIASLKLIAKSDTTCVGLFQLQNYS